MLTLTLAPSALTLELRLTSPHTNTDTTYHHEHHQHRHQHHIPPTEAPHTTTGRARREGVPLTYSCSLSAEEAIGEKKQKRLVGSPSLLVRFCLETTAAAVASFCREGHHTDRQTLSYAPPLVQYVLLYASVHVFARRILVIAGQVETRRRANDQRVFRSASPSDKKGRRI